MRHATIAIVGVGAVGAATAYSIMWKNIAAEIILVDVNNERCRGEVLDLADAIPFSCTSCVRQGSFADVGRADIIVVAAGSRQKPGQSRCELLEANKNIVTSIMELIGPLAVSSIVIMITNPVDAITYHVQTIAGFSRNQLFGSGTFLDTQRLRGLLAKRVGVSEQSIQAFMLGEHGDTQFTAWSCASIGGAPVVSYPGMTEKVCNDLTEETKNRVYDIITCKEATYYGIAACVADICETIIFDKKRVLPLSCWSDEFGVYLSLPVVLGERGIEKTIALPLNDHEHAQLSASADHIRSMIR